MSLQERGNFERKFRISLFALSDPCGRVGRKPETGMVGGCNVCNDAIYCADLDMSPAPFVRSENTEQAACVWVRIRSRLEPASDAISRA